MTTIRPATDADVPAMNALVTAVARERTFLLATEGFTLEQTRGYLAHLQANGGVSLVEQHEVDALVHLVDGILPGPGLDDTESVGLQAFGERPSNQLFIVGYQDRRHQGEV